MKTKKIDSVTKILKMKMSKKLDNPRKNVSLSMHPFLEDNIPTQDCLKKGDRFV